jgi:hypothetical protein
MGTRPTFTLPEGLKMDLTAERIAIEYEGDVEIEVDLGRRFAAVHAGGDLTVKLPSITGDLVAEGVLKVTGDVTEGGRLQGREVVLGRQTIRCKVITATERIVLGPGNFTCDVMMAPEITIDPKAQGRVTVLECHNERGASKIKGCLSLSDYEDMIGNARDFLAQRGLVPLPGSLAGSTSTSNPSSVVPSSASSGSQGRPVVPAGTISAAALSPTPTPTPRSEAPPRRAEPPDRHASGRASSKKKTDDEDVDDPLSLSLDDLEPLVEQAQANGHEEDDDLQQRLADALGRITACYEGADLPPAVEELRALVEHRDYDGLRQNITEVWNGLLGFHQKRGIRPHHQVTHAFNVIHGLVST